MMSLNYDKLVKEKIDKLLRVGFIYQIEKAIWISFIVIVSKKNNKNRVCVDYHKLDDAATILDPITTYRFPFGRSSC